MDDFSNLERDVLTMLTSGQHPVLQSLRVQLESAKVKAREFTGVGFYTTIWVPDNVEPALVGRKTLHIHDVNAEVEGLGHGAGFILYVEGGLLSLLEGFAYDEQWPSRVGHYSLRYSSPERSATYAELTE